MNVGAFLQVLGSTPGALAKQGMLTEHMDDPTLKRVVRMALDPRTRFYATDIQMPGDCATTPVYTLDAALTLVNGWRLGTRGPTLKKAYEDLLRCLSYDDAYALWCVLNKDLKAGVQAKTANKVWPDLIYIHPYMGAKADNKANRKALGISDGAVVQVKADGMYFDAVVCDGGVEFYTRQGITLDLSGTTLEYKYKQLADGVYQGEGLIMSPDGTGSWMKRDDGNGIIRRAQDGEIPAMYKDLLHHVVWDYVPLSDHAAGKSSHTTKGRLRALKDRVLPTNTHIHIIEHEYVSTWEDAQRFYTKVLASGGEGAIVKRLDGRWVSGKPRWQVKMKVEANCDLLITGWNEDKKNPGLIGSFVVESACGTIQTAAGGLSNKQKRTPPVYFIGKVGRIKFNDISSTGAALSHPRVDGEGFLRNEGSTAHTIEDIREIFADAIGGV